MGTRAGPDPFTLLCAEARCRARRRAAFLKRCKRRRCSMRNVPSETVRPFLSLTIVVAGSESRCGGDRRVANRGNEQDGDCSVADGPAQ